MFKYIPGTVLGFRNFMTDRYQAKNWTLAKLIAEEIFVQIEDIFETFPKCWWHLLASLSADFGSSPTLFYDGAQIKSGKVAVFSDR